MADVAIPEKPDVVIIPFHGESIYGLNVDGELEIILKPIIDRLGLDYWAQIQKLRNRSWAALASRQVQVPGQAQRREMLTCSVQTFAMMLATVDENKVSADIKPKLVMYQAECAKAIEDYWTKGKAVNPRIPKQPSHAEVAWHMAQALYGHEQRLDHIDGEVAELGARVDGIEQRNGWYVALAYAKINKLPRDTKSLRRLGIEASRIARRDNVEPHQVPNEAYGFVNSYPEEIWREASAIFQRAGR